MPELDLKQQGFTYSTCGTFTKHHQEIQKLKETGDLNYIYQMELDKSCFAYDAANADGKDLAKRTLPRQVFTG